MMIKNDRPMFVIKHKDTGKYFSDASYYGKWVKNLKSAAFYSKKESQSIELFDNETWVEVKMIVFEKKTPKRRKNKAKK